MREVVDTAGFDGAIEVAARLRRNVETVVLGKSETVTLVAGSVLIVTEDEPLDVLCFVVPP